MAGIPLYTSSPINVQPADSTKGQSSGDQTGNPSHSNFIAAPSDSLHSSHIATNTAKKAPVTATGIVSVTQSGSRAAESDNTLSQPDLVGNPTRDTSISRTNHQAYAEPLSMKRSAIPTLQTNAHYHQPPSATNNLSPANSAPQSLSPLARDLSHPPGYRQGEAAFYDRPVVEPENRSSVISSPTGRGQSILDNGSMPNMAPDESPVWDTAVSWAKAAGKRLSTTEAQVWKYVNGEK